MNRIRRYYQLTKPGIVRGNLLVATSGFLFASGGEFSVYMPAGLLIGVACVIASACVVNNYYDRDIDKKMKRTKKRALVTGEVSEAHSLYFAAALGAIGVVFLVVFTNLLTVILGVIAYVTYTISYTRAKRTTVHSTLIGTIPGALPLVAGYTAITGVLDSVVVLLFFIMVFWQMAHFLSIGLYRQDEYRSAGLPIAPLIYGAQKTRRLITVYILLFLLMTTSLTAFGYAGIWFGVVMAAVGAWWMIISRLHSSSQSEVLWAKKVFLVSLNVLLVFSVMLSANPLLS